MHRRRRDYSSLRMYRTAGLQNTGDPENRMIITKMALHTFVLPSLHAPHARDIFRDSCKAAAGDEYGW